MVLEKCVAQPSNNTYCLSDIVLDGTYEINVVEEHIQISWLNDNHK